MNIWSKTLLSMLRYFDALSRAVDRLVSKNATNSNYYANGKFITAYNMANRIIELTERKKKIFALKNLIEDAICLLDKEDRRLIGLAYFDGVTSHNIATLLNISDRTYFRRKNKAINSFSNKLKYLGYTDEKLNLLYGNEKWVMNFYESFVIDDDYDDFVSEIDNSKLLKNVIRELGNVRCYSCNSYF